jgi:DNA-binding MarR family transcriptional regulator
MTNSQSATLPTLATFKNNAAWRVWRDSVDPASITPQPFAKREAVRLWHEARRLERHTRKKGKQNGVLGRASLSVLQALLFDFLNYASGKCFPAYEAIARKAGVSVRTVARAIKAMRAAGVLGWYRRCRQSKDAAGRYCREQDSNAYFFYPASQWSRWRAAPPRPERGTTGEHPPMPEGQEAFLEASLKDVAGDLPAMQRELARNNSPNAQILARMLARKLNKIEE